MFHSRQAFVKICSRGSRRTSRQIHQVQNKTSNVTRGRINLNRRNDLIVAVSQSICVKHYPHSVTVCIQLVVIFYYLFCESRRRQCPYVQISFIWVNMTKLWVRPYVWCKSLLYRGVRVYDLECVLDLMQCLFVCRIFARRVAGRWRGHVSNRMICFCFFVSHQRVINSL